MKFRIFPVLVLGFYLSGCSENSPIPADYTYQLWLKYDKINKAGLEPELRRSMKSVTVLGESETCRIIRSELKNGLERLLGIHIGIQESLENPGVLIVGTVQNLSELCGSIPDFNPDAMGKEGFLIHSLTVNDQPHILVTANRDISLLYGIFHFLRVIQTEQPVDDLNILSIPRIQHRLLNHWDNLDRSVERGYAGLSLWKWEALPNTIDARYKDYARANASIGINGVVLNNVNANPVFLKTEYLLKTSKLAEIFRPYGIRIFLSVNFSSPVSSKFEIEGNRKAGIGNLPDSDPLNPDVHQWWKNKADEIYRIIPDFGGFLVKANSEGMPGPHDYGRSHADGANMLAEALEPHGGMVMWRAFVYDNDDQDRAKRAYSEFVPLDGRFKSNVFIQAKNGPIDFQPREPVQPLFGSMPKTPLMLELQITQEYLGHSTHLVYLAPMWKEYLDFDTYAEGEGSTLSSVVDGSLHGYSMTGITGVANTGSDSNWTGHFFAQANWYAFGRLAWDHSLSAEEIADEWIKMSLSRNELTVQKIKTMMMGSREACVHYMTPLGLHHIMQEGFHYGPEPDLDGTPRPDWNSVYYHRADNLGIGFNRTSSGSDAVGQYFSPLKEQFNSIINCPDIYLCWFHHVPWDYPMKSGRTFWEELCLHYNQGTAYVDSMVLIWASLEEEVDSRVHRHVAEKLKLHQRDAKIWRDTCLHYFQKFSHKEIINYNQ